MYICIFFHLLGTIFLQRVITSHVHVLQKRGLANDFIVADLDNANKEEDQKGTNSKGSHNDLENPDSDSLLISERNNIENHESDINSSVDLYDNGVSNIYMDQTDENMEERTQNSSFRDGLRIREGYQYNSSYQYSPSAPPLSLSQQRELTSLGLL